MNRTLATLVVFGIAAMMLATTSLHAQTKVAVKTAARALQPGELAVLSLTTAVPVDSLEVRAFNREVTPALDAVTDPPCNSTSCRTIDRRVAAADARAPRTRRRTPCIESRRAAREPF